VGPQLSVPTAAFDAKKEEDIKLPLKASIQLASLHPDVDLTDVWDQLKDYDWDTPLPAEVREYLFGILTEDIRTAL